MYKLATELAELRSAITDTFVISTVIYYRMVLFCLIIILSSLTTPASTECGRDERVVLPLGLFASSDVLRTAEALPAAELAVQQINEDSDILPGYCIQQKVFSSKVILKCTRCVRIATVHAHAVNCLPFLKC